MQYRVNRDENLVYSPIFYLTLELETVVNWMKTNMSILYSLLEMDSTLVNKQSSDSSYRPFDFFPFLFSCFIPMMGRPLLSQQSRHQWSDSHVLVV